MIFRRRDWRKSKARRIVEFVVILVFFLTSLGVLTFNALSANISTPVLQESSQVTAQASAMPNQGWAPLTVYYSAWGSQSTGSEISRYEWDLDGNGAYDFDATNQGGYASYTYSKPGEYIITLRVTDSQGRFATDQVKIDVRLRASSSVDYWYIFDDSRVRRIDIQLTQFDWNQMWADPEAKYQARADVIVFGESLNDVGFRMRGQFSLRESGEKKPWKIDTDAYLVGQEFHNLRQLMLLNNIGDPSMLKEKLAYEMMAFAGLPASHVAYVELWIDIRDDEQPPVYWGVYTLVERVDRKYIGNRFGQNSKDGNLYKASHAQRGPMDLIYYGESITDYPTQNGQYAYGKMNNEEEADYKDIIALCRAIDSTQYNSNTELAAALEDEINVDQFLRYLAVITLLDNWDSYPYTGNNFYLFNNPITERFEWIPWDLTWGGNPQSPLFTRGGPGLLERAPLYDLVMNTDSYKLQYAAYLDLLLRYWFTPENVTDLAQKYHRMLSPYIIQATGDKAFYGDQPMFPYEAFQNSWQELVSFVNQRNAFSQETLQTALP